MNITRILLLVFLALAIQGCATVKGPGDPQDPFESYNRTMFKFNDKVDQYVIKPVAKGYDYITPTPVQKGVSNFFSNLDDITVMFNDLLQFKVKQFFSDTGRFLVNSTIGLLGFVDVATEIGLEKHNEDFGQTLGYWGVPDGPYFVLPFLGPSTIRDTGGLTVDTTYFDPINKELERGFPPNSREPGIDWSLRSLQIINARTQLFKAENIVDEAALDRYIFIREAYLQRRKNLIYDGHPPKPKDEFSEDELFN